MEKTLYGFNSSQDVIKLQTKYTLFKRVANIIFSTKIEGGFDKELMTRCLNEVIKRNDCLRIRFVKKGGETLQYFEDERTIGKIPFLKFDSWAQHDKFIAKFRKKQADPFKGQVFQAVFAESPIGETEIIFKISHFVADTYGIGVLVNDIFGVYKALKNGTELPAAPGSFEKVLAKDLEYKANKEATEKDAAFFKDYYEVKHPDHPMFCGVQGNRSDEWLKVKRKGQFAMPYYFIACDTKGYRFGMPAAIGNQVKKWCEDNGITMSSFFFYTFAVATSLINDREKYQTPLMLLDCRGTLSERKAAGTKVQPLSIFTTVDYSISFNDNIRREYAEQQELYKHTRLTYLEAEAIQHKQWNYSMLSGCYGFCFSFIPMDAPEGVSMQILSNGKCSLPAYVALMYNARTGELCTVYDVQTKLTEPEVLADFHNTYIHVIEAVLANPDTAMEKIF